MSEVLRAKYCPECNRNRSRMFSKEYREKIKDTPASSFKRYKKRAEKKGLDFELSIDFFEKNFNSNCYWCGEKIKGIGVDRIDSSKGYIFGNVVVSCRFCNFLKFTYSKKEFIRKCKLISDRHG